MLACGTRIRHGCPAARCHGGAHFCGRAYVREVGNTDAQRAVRRVLPLRLERRIQPQRIQGQGVLRQIWQGIGVPVCQVRPRATVGGTAKVYRPPGFPRGAGLAQPDYQVVAVVEGGGLRIPHRQNAALRVHRQSDAERVPSRHRRDREATGCPKSAPQQPAFREIADRELQPVIRLLRIPGGVEAAVRRADDCIRYLLAVEGSDRAAECRIDRAIRQQAYQPLAAEAAKDGAGRHDQAAGGLARHTGDRVVHGVGRNGGDTGPGAESGVRHAGCSPAHKGRSAVCGAETDISSCQHLSVRPHQHTGGPVTPGGGDGGLHPARATEARVGIAIGVESSGGKMRQSQESGAVARRPCRHDPPLRREGDAIGDVRSTIKVHRGLPVATESRVQRSSGGQSRQRKIQSRGACDDDFPIALHGQGIRLVRAAEIHRGVAAAAECGVRRTRGQPADHEEVHIRHARLGKPRGDDAPVGQRGHHTQFVITAKSGLGLRQHHAIPVKASILQAGVYWRADGSPDRNGDWAEIRGDYQLTALQANCAGQQPNREDACPAGRDAQRTGEARHIKARRHRDSRQRYRAVIRINQREGAENRHRLERGPEIRGHRATCQVRSCGGAEMQRVAGVFEGDGHVQRRGGQVVRIPRLRSTHHHNAGSRSCQDTTRDQSRTADHTVGHRIPAAAAGALQRDAADACDNGGRIPDDRLRCWVYHAGDMDRVVCVKGIITADDEGAVIRPQGSGREPEIESDAVALLQAACCGKSVQGSAAEGTQRRDAVTG